MPSKVAQLLGAGHAGLDLLVRGQPVYITWYFGATDNSCAPIVGNADAGMTLGFDTYRDRKTGQVVPNEHALDKVSYRRVTLDREKVTYRGDPTYTIEIPVFDRDQWGISVDRILRWWRWLMARPPEHPLRQYSMLSVEKNCCAMTRLALEVGGLDLFEPPPENFFYQGTRTLLQWTRTAAARIEKLNSCRATLETAWKSAIKPQDAARMPSVKEWHDKSYVGVFARRKEQIAELDGLLARYHAAATQKNQAEVGKILRGMYLICYWHMINKPKSDRHAAVLWLAACIHNTLDALHKQESIDLDAGKLAEIQQEVNAVNRVGKQHDLKDYLASVAKLRKAQ
jgi:hypothetical protein